MIEIVALGGLAIPEMLNGIKNVRIQLLALENKGQLFAPFRAFVGWLALHGYALGSQDICNGCIESFSYLKKRGYRRVAGFVGFNLRQEALGDTCSLSQRR